MLIKVKFINLRINYSKSFKYVKRQRKDVEVRKKIISIKVKELVLVLFKLIKLIGN